MLFVYGAGNEARTRDLNLGKVALYQLSYSRMKPRIIHRKYDEGRMKSKTKAKCFNKKPKHEDLGFGNHLGWLMGLEPTTTGITILDSTN